MSQTVARPKGAAQNMVFGKSSKMSKIERYGWKTLDRPGKMDYIDKDQLQIDPAYQRAANESKVVAIAGAWSWVACGAILVGFRDGEYWVIDGQHRVLAAHRRIDVETLPCIVYDTETVKEEAKGFLNSNTLRKPMTSLDKYRAQIAAEDPVALFVRDLLDELGVTVKPFSGTPMSLASVAWVIQRATESREDVKTVLQFAAVLCHDHPLHEILLSGLHFIHTHYPQDGIGDRRLRARIAQLGPQRLLEAAKRAAAYYTRGGAKIWAAGMMDDINKNLRVKFVLTDKKPSPPAPTGSAQ